MTDSIDEMVEAENRDYAKDRAERREERVAVLIAIGGAIFFIVWWVLMQMQSALN